MQHLLIIAQVELASQSRNGAISCDLVMFELLGRALRQMRLTAPDAKRS
jgi:hypothetical protein